MLTGARHPLDEISFILKTRDYNMKAAELSITITKDLESLVRQWERITSKRDEFLHGKRPKLLQGEPFLVDWFRPFVYLYYHQDR